MQKYRYIDSLRGMAILGVVFIHSAVHGDMSHFSPFLKQFVYFGQYGVQLFFVASAFTLFLSLQNRNQFKKESSLLFLIRRFFRIAPMYYVAIGYYCFDRYIGFGILFDGVAKHPVPIDALLSNIFFVHFLNSNWTNGIVPGGWSIACEMLFYLFVPFLFAKIKSLNSAVIFFIISLFMSFAVYVILQRRIEFDDPSFIHETLPNQLPVFAIGIIAFFIVTQDILKLSKKVLSALVASLIVYFILVSATHVIFGIASLLLLLILRRKEYPLFVNRITTGLGKISFSMYVVHFAVIFWFDKKNLMNIIPVNSPTSATINLGLRYLLVVLVTAIISYITHRLIELPCQRFGSKLIARIDRSEATY